MSVPSVIKDPKTGNTARVTEFGQLVVAPVDYSTPVSIEMAVINTAYNFIDPVYKQDIVITDIILTANKNVSVNDATIIIYEATSEISTISTKDILNLQLIKQTSLPLVGLNMIVTGGKFVNAKTDDAEVFVTIMYYRVPVDVI